ncbi:MAG: HoxN/HupN/NixA family nickel/cobalt transporter, partial [Microbacteriaceae bacterium]|nr:HoxN/HupN/NixA family nickel/cobalt transporter [Microbacteriaceae bacterium]
MRLDASGARTLVLMGAVIVALFVSGFALLAAAVPGRYAIEGSGGHGVFGWATGLLALTLGIRHAFDADHIAAIDNTTRKLAADAATGNGRPGARPLAVGFFFSLGHSTIVFVMAVVLGLGIGAFNAQVQDDGSALHRVTGVVGPTVSGLFLVLIGVINILVTVGIVRVFRRMRAGEFDEAGFERELAKRGLLNRLFGRVADRIDSSWKIYPLGALFGLGFDTATEVTLLVLSGAAVLGGLPWWAVLSLPLLFAAGMCLFDTVDGVLMNYAYGWAFMTPARKVYYNVVITVMSVLVALVIGLFELASVLAGELGWHLAAIDWFDGLDSLGCIVVGTLVGTWLVAVLVWRLGRFEERLGGPGGAAPGAAGAT